MKWFKKYFGELFYNDSPDKFQLLDGPLDPDFELVDLSEKLQPTRSRSAKQASASGAGNTADQKFEK